MTPPRLLTSCLALCLLLAPTVTHAGDWLHWRGPEQTGVATDKNLPGEFTTGGKNVLWKHPLGCRSTPVVCRGKVYIIGSAGEGVNEGEQVTCFDAKSGKILWYHKFNVFLADIVTNRVGWASLAADAETGNVYAHGVQGLFFCFSPDGKVLWQRSLTEEFGRITGYGGRISSPIVAGDLVIMNMLNASWGDQGRGGHRFVAFDKRTGQIRWWSEPGKQPLDTIQSIPVTATIGGRELVICGGADGAIHAMNLANGEKVWSHYFSKRGINVSPVVDEAKGWVYIAHSEENLEATNKQGAVICLDATKITDGEPAVVWRKIGYTVGYVTPLLHEGRLYVCSNDAKMFCLDASTGAEIWNYKYGRLSRGSPVWGDGKIYIPEIGARWHILKPGEKKCEKLATVAFTRPDGLSVEVNGNAAIADGRIYLTTSDEIYCVGHENGQAEMTVPTLTKREGGAAASAGAPAKLLVEPADVVLPPGGSAEFKVVGFDAQGKVVALNEKVTWSLPSLPPPPNAPPGARTIPALQGTVTPEGKLTLPAQVPAQSGVVEAKVNLGGKELAARARVRVAPLLPIAQDFEKIPAGAVPGGWVNVAGKFQVVAAPGGGQALKKLGTNPNPLVARAYTYMGMPTLSNYTVQADLLGVTQEETGPTGKIVQWPDMGVTNCRYTLAFDGAKQLLWLRSWEAKRRLDKTIPFPWEANKWYTFKLTVEMVGDKAIARGKVWPKGEPEPAAWTIEVEDSSPNREGSPALYAYSTGNIDGTGVGSEAYFDNIRVTPNK
jgi:outer membrane protein assembly factor BamB